MAFAVTRPKWFARKAALKQVDEFLRLCRKLNEQSPNVDKPETICQIDEVVVYGSFAVDGRTDFGNVDLCVTIAI